MVKGKVVERGDWWRGEGGGEEGWWGGEGGGEGETYM